MLIIRRVWRSNKSKLAEVEKICATGRKILVATLDENGNIFFGPNYQDVTQEFRERLLKAWEILDDTKSTTQQHST